MAAFSLCSPIFGQYCTTNLYSTGCTSNDDIDDFSLGSFSHLGTGCGGTGGYNDFTSQTVEVTLTLPQNLTVTTNYTSTESFKIFIDYNGDQDFTDAGEEVYVSPNTFGSGSPLNDVITFPAGTPTGTFRMRARLVFTSTPSFTACSQETFGEIHDYTIKINPNTGGACANAFSNFSIDSISGTAAKIDWTPGTGNNSFYLEYGGSGFTPGTGTKITGTYPGSQPPVILTGLTPQTNYDVLFGEICNSGADTVYYQLPQQFSTTKLCASPTNFAYTNLTATSLDLSWNQAGTVQEFWLIYGSTGFNPATGGNIDTTTSTNYTLSGLSPVTGYDIYLVTNCASGNGVSDTVGPISVNTLIQGPQGVTCTVGSPSVLILEEFNSVGPWNGDVSPTPSAGNWSINSGPTGSGNTGPSGAYSGTSYIYYEASAPGGVATMVSPPINLTPAVDGAELSFWMHAYGADIGYFVIRVGNSATGPFNDTVFNYNNGQLQTSSTDPWQQVGVNLDAYMGQTIYLEFETDRANNNFTGDIALDRLMIQACGNFCLPEIYNLDSILPSTASAQLYVDTFSSNFQVEWGPCGFAQGTGTFVSGSTPLNLSGLSPNTCYEFYLRRDCSSSSSGFSSWNGPFSFRTLCVPYTAPYTENFDAASIPALPFCWASVAPSATTVQTVTSTDHPGISIPSAPNAVEINDAAQSFLVSPEFSDLPSGQNRVKVKIAYEGGGSGFDDTLFVGVMADQVDASTFIPVDTIFLGNSNGSFIQHIINFDDTTLIDSNTFIAFQNKTAGGNYEFYVDDFQYEAIPACPEPLYLGATAIAMNSADVYWTTGGASNWNVQYGPAGFILGNGTILSSTNDTLSLSGLSGATTYEFYVRDSCGTGSVSTWSGPFQFTTRLCDLNQSCVFTVNLFDTFGDGWNGAEISFVQGGVVVATAGAGFTTGTSFPGVQVRLCDNYPTYVILSNAGGFPSEVGFEVISPYPDTVATHVAASGFGTGDTLVTFNASCALPSCPLPTNLQAINISDNEVTLNWDHAGGASSYQVWFGPAGFYQGTQTTGGYKVISNADTLYIDTLTPGRSYEFLVRAICSPGDTSQWSGLSSWSMLACDISQTCTFTADLFDTFGDGWNGAVVSFYQNGGVAATIGAGFTTGTSFPGVPVQLCDSVMTYVVVTNLGGFPSEIGFDIYSPYPLKVASHTAIAGLSAGDTLATFMASCDVATCPFPSNLSASNVSLDSAVITWTTGGASNWELEYGPSGFNLGSGTRVPVSGLSTDTLSGLSASTWYDVYVRDSCGMGDVSLWIGPLSFRTQCSAPTPITLPFFENFELVSGPITTNGAFDCGPHHTWMYNHTGTNGSLDFNYAAYAGSQAVNLSLVTSGTYDTNYVTLNINMSNYISYTGFVYLSYYFRENSDETEPADKVWIRGDVSDPWIVIQDWNQATGGSNNWFFAEFRMDSILTANNQVFSDSTQVRWGQSDNSTWPGGDGFAFDNVSIQAATCAKPNSLTASNLTTSSVDLSWNTGGATGWQIEYGPVGYIPGTGTVVNVTSNPYTLTGLTSATAYDIYVRDSCGAGDLSLYVGPVSVSTLVCPPSQTCTYTVDLFDTFGDGWNGGLISFVQNGTIVKTVGSTFTTGTSQLGITVDLCDSIPVSVVITDLGGFPQEMGFTVNSPFLVPIGTHNAQSGLSVNDTLLTFLATCVPPSCPPPSNLVLNSVTTTSANLSWVSGGSSNWEVEYGSVGFIPGTGTRVTATSNPFTLTGLSAASTYEVYVRDSCGAGDVSAWFGPITVVTPCVPVAIPYLEEFMGPGLPACYTTFNQANQTGANAFWKFAGTWPAYGAAGVNNAPGSAGGSMGVDGSTPNDSAVSLETPQFLLGGANMPYISFKKFQNNTNGTGNMILYVDVFDGSTWHPGVLMDSANNANWVDLSIDLSSYTFTGPARFRFVVDKFPGDLGTSSAFHSDILIDDVRVFDSASTSSCQPASNLAVLNTGCDSVSVDWTSNTGNSILQYGPAGFTPGTGSFTGTVSAPYSISGLAPGTAYDVWVADICPGDTSAYYGPVSLTTASGPMPVAAMSQIADSISGGFQYIAFDATASTNATSYSWDFGNGTTGTGAFALGSYTSAGVYTVILTATNGCGSDTAMMTVLVDISLVENALSRSLNVYPNPAREEVYLSFSSEASTPVEIKISEVSGKQVMLIRDAGHAGNYNSKLDVSQLADGVYMLEISHGNMKAVRRLVKN